MKYLTIITDPKLIYRWFRLGLWLSFVVFLASYVVHILLKNMMGQEWFWISAGAGFGGATLFLIACVVVIEMGIRRNRATREES